MEWCVGYSIYDVEYEAVIPDGSTALGYMGHDEKAFEAYIAKTHPDVSMDEVEITFSIEEDNPFADFF